MFRITLDDKGQLTDAKTHVKAAREEWAEYVTQAGQQGAQTPTPPGNDGGASHTPSRAAMVAQRHYDALYGVQKGDQ